MTNCSLRNPDCKTIYDEGISVDTKAPHGIFAIANFPAGWTDPLCLVCQNKDEIVSVQIEVTQRSCISSNTCPDSVK